MDRSIIKTQPPKVTEQQAKHNRIKISEKSSRYQNTGRQIKQDTASDSLSGLKQ